LILTRTEVEALLDARELIDVLAQAMVELSAGEVSMPNRIAAQIPQKDALLAVMPAHVPALAALEVKLVSLFPHNEEIPTHQAVIICFDPNTGTPMALLDGEFITAMRTAAGSALATRLLARTDSKNLSIVGTGVQARSHARCLPLVLDFERVVVAGRSLSEAESVVEEITERGGIPTTATTDLREALGSADVVCATTHSPDPVVRREWLRAGTHINSVGYNTAGREVDAGTVADALVVVESRDAALAEAPAGSNDLLEPLREGLIRRDDIVEVGELIEGRAQGRTGSEQITLYKSVGVAVQDAAAASLVLRRAQEEGAGHRVEL
jgi:ornithine cyclodeaminase